MPQSYAFLLDRRGVVFLLVVQLGLGGLLFAVGYVLGRSAGEDAALPSAEHPEPFTLGESAHPAGPATDKEGAAESDSEESPPEATGAAQVAAPAVTPEPAQADEASPVQKEAPASSEPAADGDSDGQSSAPSEPDSESQQLAVSTPQSEEASPGAVGLPRPAYSIQVGAFAQPRNARMLISDLKSRGYEPHLYEITTVNGRRLESVRIGHYLAREEASTAAAAFRLTEKMDALVQRERGLSVSAVDALDEEPGVGPAFDRLSQGGASGGDLDHRF